MGSKGMFVLAGAAAVLGVAAYMAGGSSSSAPSAVGERIVGDFDIERIASIDVGDKVRLVAGEDGWVVPALQDYPADRAKIADALLKLSSLKVGQVVRGRRIEKKTPVVARDASGAEVFSVVLGERHEKWGYGRYVEYKGQAVLTGEPLDAFGDDPKRWCDTKIVDDPWISFNALAEPDIDDARTGLSTGVVAKVTIAGDTNRVATVGAAVEGGTDRYLKIDGLKWTFIVPSYSVDRLLPKPEPKETPAESESAESPSSAEDPAPAAESTATSAPAEVPAPAEAASAEASATPETLAPDAPPASPTGD